jgi:hypothetical protein
MTFVDTETTELLKIVIIAKIVNVMSVHLWAGATIARFYLA